MALKQFIGGAPVVAGQKKITIASATSAQTQIVTVGSRTETYTNPTGLTVAQVAANLTAQLAASRAPEFSELQFVNSSSADIYVTHTDFSQDFSLTVSGTGSPTVATVFSTTGPGDWGNAANWTGGTLPADGDDILVDLPDTPITMGLTGLSAINPGTVRVKNRANAGIGLPEFKRSGSLLYREYRTRFIVFSSVDFLIVDGDGPGPRVLNVTVSGVSGVGNCVATIASNNDSPSDENAPIQLDFRGSGNTLDMTRGLVQIPTTGVFATCRIGRETDNDNSPTLWNDGTIATGLFNLGGLTRSSTAVTLTQNRGSVEHDQTAGNLTATIYGGLLIFRPDATLDVTANGPDTIVDVSRSTNLKTIDAGSTFRNGVRFLDPHGRTAGQSVRDLFDSLSLRNSVFGDSV